jgi:hypothetical protein
MSTMQHPEGQESSDPIIRVQSHILKGKILEIIDNLGRFPLSQPTISSLMVIIQDIDRSDHDSTYAVDKETMDNISFGLFNMRVYANMLEDHTKNTRPDWWPQVEKYVRHICALHGRKVLDRQDGRDFTRGSSDDEWSG